MIESEPEVISETEEVILEIVPEVISQIVLGDITQIVPENISEIDNLDDESFMNADFELNSVLALSNAEKTVAEIQLISQI